MIQLRGAGLAYLDNLQVPFPKQQLHWPDVVHPDTGTCLSTCLGYWIKNAGEHPKKDDLQR